MTVRLIDGSEIEAIAWCVDELTFTPADAIGRTVEELRALRHRRDVEYPRYEPVPSGAPPNPSSLPSGSR
jgi:hypothetical protein